MTATLLRGGRVVGRGNEQRDVLIRDGVVAEIGGSIEPTGADTVDLEGRFLGAGMWDHHVHFSQWALKRQRIDLTGAESAAHAVSLVGDWISRNPARQDVVVVGYGFKAAIWPDTPSIEILDEVSAGRPVALVSNDIHAVWLNTDALRRYGHPSDGIGILRESAAFAVTTELSDVGDDVLDGWVADAASAAAARGVVGIVDLEMAPGLDNWSRRIRAGTRSLRVKAGVYLDHIDDAIGRGLRTGDVVPDTSGLLELGPFKIITDGSLNTRTAFCHEPYPGLDPTAEGAAGISTCGFDELVGHLRRASRHGILPTVHAIGDRANHLALDAFSAARCRGTIEHAQLVDSDDFVRFAELAVVASVQPEHAMDDRDVADRLWPGRTDRAFAFESLLAAGATIRLGSDAPVAPLDPWVSMAAAVSRRRDGREPWHPEQRIAQHAAYAASVASPLISTGERADLTITDVDPLSAADDELRSMAVSGTMVRGEWTHRRL